MSGNRHSPPNGSSLNFGLGISFQQQSPVQLQINSGGGMGMGMGMAGDCIFTSPPQMASLSGYANTPFLPQMQQPSMTSNVQSTSYDNLVYHTPSWQTQHEYVVISEPARQEYVHVKREDVRQQYYPPQHSSIMDHPQEHHTPAQRHDQFYSSEPSPTIGYANSPALSSVNGQVPRGTNGQWSVTSTPQLPPRQLPPPAQLMMYSSPIIPGEPAFQSDLVPCRSVATSAQQQPQRQLPFPEPSASFNYGNVADDPASVPSQSYPQLTSTLQPPAWQFQQQEYPGPGPVSSSPAAAQCLAITIPSYQRRIQEEPCSAGLPHGHKRQFSSAEILTPTSQPLPSIPQFPGPGPGPSAPAGTMAAPPTVPSNSPGPSGPIRGSKKRHRPTGLSISSTTSIARPPLYDSPPNTPTYGQSRGVSESLPASPLAPYQPTILTPYPPRRPPRMGLMVPEPQAGEGGADQSFPTPWSPGSMQKNMSEVIGASPRSATGTRINGPPTPTTESAESSAKNSVASSPNLSGSSRRPNYTKWTPAEDNLLRASIAIHGTSKWSAVAAMVPGRTPMQCSTRWSGALNTTIHKGRWEKDEDEILVKAVDEWKRYRMNHSQSASFGAGSSSPRKASTKGKDADDEEDDEEKEANDPMKAIPWSDIALLLPRKRTGIQCQARWSEALDPTVRKGKWSSEEDAALLNGIERYGPTWIKVQALVPNRTQRQCRTRWVQIQNRAKNRREKETPHEEEELEQFLREKDLNDSHHIPRP